MAEPPTCPGCGIALPAGATGPCATCPAGAAQADTISYARPLRPAAGLASRPRTPAEPLDRPTLVRTLRELGLVDPAALDRLEATTPGDSEPLARALVRAGELSAYQAGAVLQGKARGLSIGPYLVLEKLGMGGMGVVFKARHRERGQVVALKILPPSFARDPQAVSRFRREFAAAARLRHPNLVAAVEASEDRGVHFLTMEYIEGTTLDRLVRDGGPLPIALALHGAIEVARGLEAAHARGVIHRDIKPGNVMIDAAGGVRVLDLGLARLIEEGGSLAPGGDGSLTRTGAYLGTVDYLAPEQAEDARAADARADLYGLGCTLHYLLTGRPPFGGDSLLGRLIAHRQQPPPSLRAARPEVPEALEAAYLGLMAKRPEDRPRSASEVICVLEAVRASLDGSGEIGADLKSFARPSPGSGGRERGVTTGVATAGGAVAVGGSGTSGWTLDLNLELGLDGLLDPGRSASGREPGAAPAAAGGPLWGAWIAGGVAILGLFAGIAWLALHRAGRADRSGAAEVAVFDGAETIEDGMDRLSEPADVDPAPGAIAAAEAPPVPAPAPPADDPAPIAAEPGDMAAPPPPPGGTTPAGPPAPAPPRPADPPVDPARRVLFADEFDDPTSGWRRDEEQVIEGGLPFRRNYTGDGTYFLDAPEGWVGAEAWNCTSGPIAEDFEIEAVGRVLGAGAGPAPGGWGLVLYGPRNRGFQAGIDGAGMIAVDPGFWGVKDFPGDPHYLLPAAHRAIRPGRQWNTLTLRVRRRQLEVLVNGARMGRPIRVDWDVLPAMPQIAIFKPLETTRVRAEFDRVVIRALPPAAAERGRDARAGGPGGR